MLELVQIHAIVDRLCGREEWAYRPADLDEPWRTVYGRLPEPGRGPPDRPALELALWEATGGLADRAGVYETLRAQLPEAEALRRFRTLAELAVDLPPIDWLWPAWIPKGLLSLLGAAPGAGKSLVALDLARRILHDGGFPDGAAVPCPGSPVIYVDAEAIPQVLNERALAWGLDRSRLYVMLPAEPYGLIDFGAEEDQDTLVQMCYELRPGFVVVDSLSSISLKGENNVEDVRAILSFLGAVAREFDLGLLLIHHLRKMVAVAVDYMVEEVEACDCEDELDFCPYCLLQAARDALERLAESDPFAEAPARVVREAGEPRIIE